MLLIESFAMSHEEIEVKFPIEDLPALRLRVIALGARCKIPRTYETNICFDTPDQRLAHQRCLLRLRRDQRTLLTYKEPAATAERDFKIRQEYEIEVSDFAQTQALLEKLGFVPILRYEKYRETFTYQGAEILLDEMPFGTFMEIEGSREVIRTIAARLELDFESRLTASYGEIFTAIRAVYKLPITDMTFDNFRTLHIDLHACHLT
jgi:adenylate cyclase class 2